MWPSLCGRTGFAHEKKCFARSRIVLIGSALAFADESCAKLAGLKIPGTTITSAQSVAAGSFVGPPEPEAGQDNSALYKTLPAFCRVVAQGEAHIGFGHQD